MITSFKALQSHRDLFIALVRRELRVRYRRTALGWLWAFVNPAINTLIYSFVFVVVFQIRPLPGDPSGNSYFAFFLLSASLPWNFLAGSLIGGMASLSSSASLISRVYFPRELIPIASVVALAVSFVIELGMLIVLLLPFGFVAIPYLPCLVALVILQTLFVSGLALWLSALNVRYRDTQHIVSVLLLVWFYLTPIIYNPDRLPVRHNVFGLSVPVRSLLMFNPMARFSIAYRNCLFDLRFPSAATWLACAVSASVVFYFGDRFYRRRSPRFVEEF